MPDPKTLNTAIPPEESEIGLSGNPEPPWSRYFGVYVMNTAGEVFSSVNKTQGQSIAFGLLTLAIKNGRMIHGDAAWPVIRFEFRVFHSPKYGDIHRPHFPIRHWVLPGGLLAAAPQPISLAPPSLRQELDDEIPSWDPRHGTRQTPTPRRNFEALRARTKAAGR